LIRFQVDTFDIRICLAKTQRHVIDFMEADETDLHRIDIPYEFHILQSGTVHGLAFWFDVAFVGSAGQHLNDVTILIKQNGHDFRWIYNYMAWLNGCL
jgi:hypothetical protein